MPESRDVIERGLLSKGFVRSDSHHKYFRYYTCQGKKTDVRTFISHTPKMREVPDQIVAQMARQCQLKRRQFLELVRCPLDRSSYEAHLLTLGIIGAPEQ